MNNTYLIMLGIMGAIVIFVSIRAIKRAVLKLFGGSIELSELAGCLFAGLFTYMIIKEGNRTHEWHYYSELYIFFTAGAAMTGLGLSKVLETIKEMRLGSSGNSTITNTQTQERKVTNESNIQ